MKPNRHLNQIIADIKATQPPPGVACKIIAIDGLGGAGKSTLARELSQALGGVPIIAVDDFGSWGNPFGWWPEMVEKALKPLSTGKAAQFQRSDYLTGGQTDEQIEIIPADYIILEGVSASCRAFRLYLAYTVWVETPRAERLRRGVERGGENTRGKWEQWMRAEDDYVNREQPQQHADTVINGFEP